MCMCMVRLNAILTVVPQVRSFGEVMIWVLEYGYGFV